VQLYVVQTDTTQPDLLKHSVHGYFSPWDKFSVSLGEMQDTGLAYLIGSFFCLVWFLICLFSSFLISPHLST